MGEQLALHGAQVYGLPVISIRLFNVYGPRARTSGTYGAVFGVFLAQLLNKQPLTIVGDGEQTRDFTFVSDVVEGFLTVANSDKTEKPTPKRKRDSRRKGQIAKSQDLTSWTSLLVGLYVSTLHPTTNLVVKAIVVLAVLLLQSQEFRRLIMKPFRRTS